MAVQTLQSQFKQPRSWVACSALAHWKVHRNCCCAEYLQRNHCREKSLFLTAADKTVYLQSVCEKKADLQCLLYSGMCILYPWSGVLMSGCACVRGVCVLRSSSVALLMLCLSDGTVCLLSVYSVLLAFVRVFLCKRWHNEASDSIKQSLMFAHFSSLMTCAASLAQTMTAMIYVLNIFCIYSSFAALFALQFISLFSIEYETIEGI